MKAIVKNFAEKEVNAEMYWELDNAIVDYENLSYILENDAKEWEKAANKTTSTALALAEAERCRKGSEKNKRLAAWLKEYKRLRSIIGSKDGRITTEYIINTDNASYQFNYIEGYGVRINAKVYGNKLFQLAQTPVEPMDFEEFKKWCEREVGRAEA